MSKLTKRANCYGRTDGQTQNKVQLRLRLYENEYNKYDFSNKDRIKYLVLLAFIFYVFTLHRKISYSFFSGYKKWHHNGLLLVN